MVDVSWIQAFSDVILNGGDAGVKDRTTVLKFDELGANTQGLQCDLFGCSFEPAFVRSFGGLTSPPQDDKG